MIKHFQCSPNSKLAMSLQYLKKELKYEVDFLHGNENQSFLQGDTVIIGGHDQAFSNTQSNKFAISLQYLKKEVRDGVHFLDTNKQSFYKLTLSLLTEVARLVQNTQNKKLLIFLQYLQ